MIPLIVTGALVFGSILCALLARALRERDMARVSLGIARMELLDVRCRLADTHRRVIELERQADRPPASPSDAALAEAVAGMRQGHPIFGHPMLGRSIPGGAR